jgi:hypothetical protein
MHLNKAGIDFMNFVFSVFGFGHRRRAIVGTRLARVNSFMAPENSPQRDRRRILIFVRLERKQQQFWLIHRMRSAECGGFTQNCNFSWTARAVLKNPQAAGRWISGR